MPWHCSSRSLCGQNSAVPRLSLGDASMPSACTYAGRNTSPKPIALRKVSRSYCLLARHAICLSPTVATVTEPQALARTFSSSCSSRTLCSPPCTLPLHEYGAHGERPHRIKRQGGKRTAAGLWGRWTRSCCARAHTSTHTHLTVRSSCHTGSTVCSVVNFVRRASSPSAAMLDCAHHFVSHWPMHTVHARRGSRGNAQRLVQTYLAIVPKLFASDAHVVVAFGMDIFRAQVAARNSKLHSPRSMYHSYQPQILT